jgi:hypothetical protein
MMQTTKRRHNRIAPAARHTLPNDLRLEWVEENECFLSAVRTNVKKKNWNRVNVFEKMESRDSA